MLGSLGSLAIRRRASAVPVSIAIALLIGGCATGHGAYTWIDDYALRAPETPSGFVIGNGDVVNVQVFDNEKISARGRVRGDGKLALPLVGEVDAAGKTPRNLALDIERSLQEQKFVLNPRVTVVVDEVQPLKVSVLGAVARAGTYSLDGESGVAEALASAGGLTDFAHKDQIYVLRRLPTPLRLRFTFQSLTEVGRAAAFRLRTGDVVVAE